MGTQRSITIILFVTANMALAGAAFAAGADTFRNGQSFYGEPANGTQNARVVDLATAKYANVKYGETVKFVSAGKTFVWTFNGIDQRAVNLAKIAPQDFEAKSLTVYVDKNPLNRR